MTESEAREILQASLECEEKENAVIFDYQCDKDCEACGLNYAQGTVGEHKEAMQMAIKALEKQEKIKEEFKVLEVDTAGYFGSDDETTNLIFALKKILRE